MLQCFGFVHPISNSSSHLILTNFGSDFVNQKHTTQIEHRAFHFLNSSSMLEIDQNTSHGRKHLQLYKFVYVVFLFSTKSFKSDLLLISSLRTDTQQNFQPAIIRQLKHRKKVFISIIQTERKTTGISTSN